MTGKALVAALALLTLSGCNYVLGASTDEEQSAAQPAAEAKSPAQRAFSAANARMHAGMGRIDEDADIAFMEGMIPHHQGAIDMANAVIEYGDDPEAKDLARRIIAAQGEEIAEINAWLARKRRAPAPAAAVDHKAMGH